MRPESLAGHLYIPGTKKKFRVWYDKIVDFKSFSDRFGIMRVAQSAKPRSFRTGTGWFAFDLAVNLTHMQRDIKPGALVATSAPRLSEKGP